MPLRADDVATFHAHGVIVVRGLFSADEVDVARAAFERLWARAQTLGTTGTWDDALFVLQPRERDVVVQRIVWAGGAEPDLLRLGQDERLVEPALQLLETSSCDQLLNQAHFKMPGDGVAFDWHQDIQHRDKGPGTWNDVTGRGSYVQSILLVDDMRDDNGPLQFLPDDAVPLDARGRLVIGHDDYSATPATTPGATLLPTSATSSSVDASRAVTMTGRAGDVLFFGPYAVHGSLPNVSTSSRRVLINGYAAPGANGRMYPGSGLGVRLPR
jgi:ectoine hydroxylase-related dioxygenase (phytanoyl-CoA dioxygenase family)